MLEESLSSTKSWAEAWPHQDSVVLKDAFGPVKLFKVTVAEASEHQMTEFERQQNLIPPLSRGMLCSWEWGDDEVGRYAISNNIRPLGKVITSIDRPHMRGCEFAIQVVDSEPWAFDTVGLIEMGGKFIEP